MIHWKQVLLLSGSDELEATSDEGTDLLFDFRETGEMPGFWPVHPERETLWRKSSNDDLDRYSLAPEEIDWSDFPYP